MADINISEMVVTMNSQLSQITTDMKNVMKKLDELSSTKNDVTILQTEMLQVKSDVKENAKKIDKLESGVQKQDRKTGDWAKYFIDKVFWIVMAIVIGFILKKAGIV